MKYQNPILRGFNPDPSIIRVADDYYLAVSSFEFYPGVPIYHSKNLVNWQLIGHCLTTDTQLPLDHADNSDGIYAPTLRYHNGTFYMITTNVSCGGNFIVRTQDIYGSWSDPVYIDHQGIDPSLLFDDGKVYFTATDWEGIALYEIDADTGRLLSDKTIVSKGISGKNPEAPHLYKINDWYYLMIAEGGTEYGHMETIFRAKHPLGPYTSCSHNPILSHRYVSRGAIRATGHADLVQDQNGNWWAVCLGIRVLGGQLLHNLGRETFLASVSWDSDGWPHIGDNGMIALEADAPLPAPVIPLRVGFTDGFISPALDPAWTFVRKRKHNAYRMTEAGLRLTADSETLNSLFPTAALIRQQEVSMYAHTVLHCNPTAGRAGLVAYYSNEYHAEIALCRMDGTLCVQLTGTVHGMTLAMVQSPVPETETIDLFIETDEEAYRFLYDTGQGKILLGQCPTAAFCTEGTKYMSFTGTFLGIFAEKTEAVFRQFSCVVTGN